MKHPRHARQLAVAITAYLLFIAAVLLIWGCARRPTSPCPGP